jgi:chromate transporter
MKEEHKKERTKGQTLIDLFIGFLRVGFFGFGGGPSSIPLMYKEAVDKYGWTTSEEFGDILAIGNTLPGPIGVKVGGYIGYKQGGILGVITAVGAEVIPVAIIMIIVLTSLASIRDQAWVQGITYAVVPVVAVMLGSLTWQFTSKAEDALGWPITIGLIVFSAIMLEVVGIHPAILIASLILFALLKPQKKGSE